MAASTREVYLLLRARDEASRVVRGFSSELLRSAASAAAAIRRAEAESHRQAAAQLRAAGATRAVVQAHLDHARVLENEARAIEESERRHRRFAQSLGAVSGALETIGIGFAIVGGLTLKFVFDSTKAYATYQQQVAHTKTQVDGFTTTVGELGAVGMDIARRIPVAFDQIQPALFDIFSSTNANLEQSKILLEGFSKAAVAGQTDIQTAARGTISIMNAYNIPFEQVNRILDIQFELVRKGVGTYSEFAAVFGRVVPSATRAGQSFETIAAMLAFMTRNGQSAAAAATAAARSLEAFTHPATVARLERMGVEIRDAHGNFLPLIDVLTQLRQKILKLPAADRVKELFELFKGAGGTIQARRFIEQVLLREGELENFRDLLVSMGNASGVMEDKFTEMADTAASKMQLLSNRWQALRVAIGEAALPLLLQIVDVLNKIVEWFNRLDSGTKKTVAQFLIWGGILSIVGGILITFIGFLAGLTAAFVVAGAEILIVLGAITAIGAAFGVAGTAILTLWKKSEGFRNAIRNLKDAVVDLWKEGIQPTFQTLAQFWADKVQPAVDAIIKSVGDDLSRAFAIVASLVREQLIPMLERASDWYERNKASVDRAIGVLIVFAKWVGIIGGVILAVFVGIMGSAAITSIMLFISSVMALVAIWTATVDAIVAASKFLQKVWQDVWPAVKSFFIDVWNAIANFFTRLWNDIVATVVRALGFIRQVWEQHWSIFGGLFKAVWELILALAELAFVTLRFLFASGLAYLQMIWNTVWGEIKSTAESIWGSIVVVFSAIWSALVALWNAIWEQFGTTLDKELGSVRNRWVEAWNTVKNFFASVWSSIWSTLNDWAKRIRETVFGIFRDILSFFGDAGEWLFNSGKAIVQGLINGITSKIRDLTDKIREVARIIADHLPRSPAKKGPLSGTGSPLHSGMAIGAMLAEGMMRKADEVAMASLKIAQQVAFPMSSPGVTPYSTGTQIQSPVGTRESTAGALTTMNDIDITINTQEIDPRVTGTELGWELAGRLTP